MTDDELRKLAEAALKDDGDAWADAIMRREHLVDANRGGAMP